MTNTIMRKMNEQKNKNKKNTNAHAALPANANDRMGERDLGRKYDHNDLGHALPNSWTDNSGDPNQISRSEEEEMENNTSTLAPKKFNF